MATKRTWLGWGVALLAGGCVALAYGTCARSSGRAPIAGQHEATHESPALALVDVARAAAGRDDARETPPNGAADVAREGRDALEGLLAELRAAEPSPTFHELAWPVLTRASALVETGEPAPSRSRLTAVARGDEGDRERVRSACLVALALARSPTSPGLAAAFLASGAHELERAGWIALGLLADGEEGLTVELGSFRWLADFHTFPARLARVADPATVARAIQRVQTPVPASVMAVSTEPGGNLPRLEEGFTRSIVVLATLGPGAGRPGPVRETLLGWLRGVAPVAWLADDAVLHCLAAAARGDDELAARLLDLAAARLLEPEGTAILEALVRLGGQERLVLGHLRGFFASEDAIEGDPLYSLTQVQAAAALMPLLGSEDAGVREEAAELVLARLHDPGVDGTERLLLLASLAEHRGELVLDAVVALVEGDGEGDGAGDGGVGRIEHAVPFLDALPPDQSEAGRAWLVSLLARDGLSSRARVAVLRELSQLAGDEWDALRASLRAAERDPEAQAFLDASGAGGGG